MVLVVGDLDQVTLVVPSAVQEVQLLCLTVQVLSSQLVEVEVLVHSQEVTMMLQALAQAVLEVVVVSSGLHQMESLILQVPELPLLSQTSQALVQAGSAVSQLQGLVPTVGTPYGVVLEVLVRDLVRQPTQALKVVVVLLRVQVPVAALTFGL